MLRSVFRVIIVSLVFVASPVAAQKKQLKEARTYIKKNNSLDKAEKLMTDLLKDSANRQNPKIYQTWFEAVEKQYDQGNEKLYLKQQYDTATLFNNALRMFPILETLDSIDSEHKYRKANSQRLNGYRTNIYFGGTFFTKKQQYDKAFPYFDTYIDCIRQPLFEQYRYAETDTLMRSAAYWATFCGYRLNDADKTLKYAEMALPDSARKPFVLQYMAEAYRWKGDTANYLSLLKKGFALNPKFSYFFPRIVDYYTESDQPDSVLAYSNEALKTDSASELFLYAKSTALLNLGKYDECIAVSDTIIAHNDSLPDPYYNAGTAWLNKAFKTSQQKKSRNNKNKLKKQYTMARPYIERYRELAPDQKQKWAPALYRIYLNLNMGKKFEEIDKILTAD